MAKRIVQNRTRNSEPLAQTIKLENNKVIVQNKKREVPRLPSFSSTTLFASCWDDPKANVIFFANNRSFLKNFFDVFDVNAFIHDNIMGTAIANHAFDFVTKLPTFKQSAHLPDGLYHGDWKNEFKYIPRIKKHVPWREHFGEIRFEEPVIVIAPSGSHKDLSRQRYLNNNEYKQLVEKYLNKGYRVYVTGAINDIHHFGLINRENFYWLTSEQMHDGKGNITSSNLLDIFKIVNGAELVISVDTWLKCYSLLCGIPTHVVKTRWNGKYDSIGEHDVADWIFLNPNMWQSIKSVTIEEILT